MVISVLVVSHTRYFVVCPDEERCPPWWLLFEMAREDEKEFVVRVVVGVLVDVLGAEMAEEDVEGVIEDLLRDK